MTIAFSKVETIPPDYKHLISEDVLGEVFHSGASHKYIYGQESPVGVIAYTLDIVGGKTLPRFIHVSIEPKYRATEEVNNFLNLTELALLSEGYTQTFAAIEHNKKYMHKTAKYYGFKEYHKDDENIYYFKNIQVPQPQETF